MNLVLSHNSKTKFFKSHKNTFGLTYGLPKHGGTCPGATTGNGGCCAVRDGLKRQTCYMAKVVAIYKAVGKVLSKNKRLLTNKSYNQMVDILTETVEEFVKKTRGTPYFRLHYSGDFFSEDYAKAWAHVIKQFPQVRFWVYTRSHDLVKYLVDIDNLTLFISVDPDNKESGYTVYEEYKDKPNVGLAWMGNEQPTDRRWVTCPETSGKIKNTDAQGACAKCRLCIDRIGNKVRNIQFLIH